MSETIDRDTADERAVLAKMLTTNAEFLAEVLHPAAGTPTPSVMAALRAARSLDSVVDDVLRSLVQQARDEGRTWAEVGEIFGTSRQAAFQRFGGGPSAMPIPPAPPVPHLPQMPQMPPTPPIPPLPNMPKLPEMPGMPVPPFMGHAPKGPQPPTPGQRPDGEPA
ncbi:hypothetical protein LTV02_09875 [Nocardia yamanashiensis]|uniref:hypothetical protein n=1 Tax=Nocardia yamanashiensis TaxID=209247 RepID=UPI000AC34D48|nr:hypothetical protein [Nocardia yamanashiensis]UGT43664.1 hypothetical protein LTV02_09875 [Nocardia yamanashiensis]